MDNERRCSVCGNPAVAVYDLDSDHPDWRCATHTDAQMEGVLGLTSLFNGDEPLNCIVCGVPADVGRAESGALIWYCQHHANQRAKSD